MKEEYYIAYIIIPYEFPESGMDMLFFYTKKGDKYYWGTDNNSFNQEFMDDLENKKKIIKLPELIKLEEGTELGFNKSGKIYLGKTADMLNYESFGSKNLKCLEGIILK